MTVVGVHTQERTARQTVAIGLRFAESRRIIPSDSAIKTQNGNVTPSPYAEKNASVSMPCAENSRTRLFHLSAAMRGLKQPDFAVMGDQRLVRHSQRTLT